MKFLALSILSVACCFSARAQLNCGTVTPEGYTAKLRESVMASARKRSQTLKQVPVKVHILRQSDGTGGLPANDLYNVIDSMNAFYANAAVEFVLCGGIDYIDDNYFYNYQQDDENLLGLNDVPGLINIYFANTVTSSSGGGLCGYAYYPGGPDRILMANPCAVNFSTMPHEMGHFMGLIHTHGPSNSSLTTELVNGSNCSSDGDLICDTPADPMLTYTTIDDSCQYSGTAVDANNDSFAPDSSNIMSYSRKHCRNRFSAEQYQVIEYTAYFDRNYFLCITTSSQDGPVKEAAGIYPNPADDRIWFFGFEKEREFRLFSVTGELVLSATIGSGSFSLPVAHLSPGMYLYALDGNTGRLVIR